MNGLFCMWKAQTMKGCLEVVKSLTISILISEPCATGYCANCWQRHLLFCTHVQFAWMKEKFILIIQRIECIVLKKKILIQEISQSQNCNKEIPCCTKLLLMILPWHYQPTTMYLNCCFVCCINTCKVNPQILLTVFCGYIRPKLQYTYITSRKITCKSRLCWEIRSFPLQSLVL